ncbi:MAG: hypothetical protein K0Q65_680 [Clostridia bacterium]|jgi:transcription elongation factor Elf1/DNA-binding transcriptional regulator YbjK|nr:hypothetical protein [Clostridia bacterium]
MKEFMFDPKMFINEPYWDCPKCNANASFGVISIGGNHYHRKCKECRYSEGYSLPELNKKIIYIDQFAISNMEKALNPKVSPEQRQRIDRFWADLFNLLDTLCKMQLIICPDSITHENESMAAKDHYKALKRMYEQLSHGTSFEHFNTIERFQLCEVAENWIQGNPDKGLEMDIETAVHGDINEWQDRLIVTVEISNFEKDAEILSQNRQDTQMNLNKLIDQWRQLNDFDFDKQWEIELSAYGRTIAQQYIDYYKNFMEVGFGISKDFDKLMRTDILALVHSIVEVIKAAGVSEEDSLKQAFEFLRSPYLKNVPFIQISTLMYAALARKAVNGQKKAKASFFNDVRTISCLKPYCDAMFVDNECASLLNEEPLRTCITGGAKIFSLNTKEQFLEYLEEIIFTAPKEHIDKVEEVYGKRWRRPFTTMYHYEKDK